MQQIDRAPPRELPFAESEENRDHAAHP